ncbi:MAG: helix-turn-helix domain-containing protein [Treponema sp.]|nr:helix-turn-helix domain-containing protein [Treponema sp.]
MGRKAKKYGGIVPGEFAMDGQGIRDTLGKNVRIWRERRGFSQSGLAELSGISISFLSNVERGLKFPQPEVLAKLALILGVSVGELFSPIFIDGEGKISLRESPAHTQLLDLMHEDLMKDVSDAVSEVFRRYLK